MDPPASFKSTPEWIQYAEKNGITLPSSRPSVPLDAIAPIKLDYKTSRARQALEHAQWRTTHPLSSVGYVSTTLTTPSSSGHPLEVKISWPTRERIEKSGKTKLPVLFACFGGGWIQGGHTSEECWLLWPVYPAFDVVVVSVDYRLGPEHGAPVWVEDCWDVLAGLLSASRQAGEGFAAWEADTGLRLDREKVVLVGSSAGAGIAAALSLRCRDAALPVRGVVLNVPVLCDYRHFSHAERAFGVKLRSYGYATEALLPSGAMKWIWDTLYPDPEKSRVPDASPLLGNMEGLPQHVVFVAGQDALCDEGVAYAGRLREAGAEVALEVYEGVPHVFGEMWGLEATGRWWGDLRRYLGGWLEG